MISQDTRDKIFVEKRRSELTREAQSDGERARLVGGKWICAIISLSVGAMLKNNTPRIAAGLPSLRQAYRTSVCARSSRPQLLLERQGHI